MRRNFIRASNVVACLLCVGPLLAQQVDSGSSGGSSGMANTAPTVSSPAAGTIPRLVRFSGRVKDIMGNPAAGTVGLTFALYELSEGGTPLWTENQNLSLDEQGHYTALLGADSPNGLPLDLFTSSKALWLGVQPQLPGAAEQPRVLLVAVPYALKSSDADTLGGLPASAFMLAPNTAETPGVNGIVPTPISFPPPPPVPPVGSTPPTGSITGSGLSNFVAMFTSGSTIGTSPIFISPNGSVGIGTTNPTGTLGVNGAFNLQGNLSLTALNGVNPTLTVTDTDGSSFSVSSNVSISDSDGLQGTIGPDPNAPGIQVNGSNQSGPNSFGGGQVNLNGGDATTGFGGTINISGGYSTAGEGGNINITPGKGGSPSMNGVVNVNGDLQIAAGGKISFYGDNTTLTTGAVPTLTATSNIFSGNITASSFTGDGSNLRNLNPGFILPGTAPISISGNSATSTNASELGGYVAGSFPLLDGTNNFTAANTFEGMVTEAGGAVFPALGTATASGGFNSTALSFLGSVYSNGVPTPLGFFWQAEPVNNNTTNASGRISLMSVLGDGPPAETGFSIGTNGLADFGPGQTFTGTLSDVAAGTDLTESGSGSNVTLSLDTTKVPTLNAQTNAFTGSLNAAAGTFYGSTGPIVSGTNSASGAVGQLGTTANGSYTGVYGSGSTGVYGSSNSLEAEGGIGVVGTSPTGALGYGVYGTGDTGVGGQGNPGVSGSSILTSGGVGVQGNSIGTGGTGVSGVSHGLSGIGVNAVNDNQEGYGVYATGTTGVYGSSTSPEGEGGIGVDGLSPAGALGYGVYGTGDTGVGGKGNPGVFGSSQLNTGGVGVEGASIGTMGLGVSGVSHGPTGVGLNGMSDHGQGGYGVFAVGDTGVYGANGNLANLSSYGELGTTISGAATGVYGNSSGQFGTGVQGVSAGVEGIGVEAYSMAGQGGTGVTAEGDTGVYATSTATSNGVGVVANGYTGVQAISAPSGGNGGNGLMASSSGSNGSAVTANSTGMNGIGVSASSSPGQAGTAILASGDTGLTVTATGANGYGVYAGGWFGVYGQSSTAACTGACPPSGVGVWGVGNNIGVLSSGNLVVSGDLNVTGMKSAVVSLPDDRIVALYAVESPENWFEDFGSAQLHEGVADVTLDSTFALTVNAEDSYHVFLTPNGDCKGLYVVQKAASGFQVRELQGGRSSISFDYRIVAKRRGYENVRLADLGRDQETAQTIRQAAFRRPANHMLIIPSPRNPPQPQLPTQPPRVVVPPAVRGIVPLNPPEPPAPREPHSPKALQPPRPQALPEPPKFAAPPAPRAPIAPNLQEPPRSGGTPASPRVVAPSTPTGTSGSKPPQPPQN